MTQPVEDEPIEQAPGLRALLIASFVVLGVVVVFVLLYVTVLDEERAAGLGNAMGVVAALFSGLAFAGVIYALLMQRAELRLQRHDLALQRRELKLTREEVAGQRQELAQQNATLQQQSFEVSFFQLLRFWRESMRFVQANPSGLVVNGVSAFEAAAAAVQHDVHNLPGIVPFSTTVHAAIQYVFQRRCLAPHSDFSSYFDTLLALLWFVETRDPPARWRYTEIMRSQLSNTERILLFFYGFLNAEQSVPLFSRYGLLKNMRFYDDLIEKLKSLSDFYPPNTYQQEGYLPQARTEAEDELF